MSEAMIPTRSLFMYPGYLSVWVLAAITVDTYTTLNNIRSKVACTYELIRLIETWVLEVQAVRSNTRECTIVEDDNRVCVVCEPLEGQECVVGLHNDVSFLCIGKDGICLDELLREFVVEPFQQE